MSDINNNEILGVLVKQFQNFTKSSQNLTKKTLSKEINMKLENNYHLIDHNWINKWKEKISYNKLIKEKIGENNERIREFIKKNMNDKELTKLNNQNIYYNIKDKFLIDPMKEFDLVSDEAWASFDIKNENSKYNGKVSILKGNKKIIIKFDENNYLVKYLISKNKFAEFIILFNPPENEYKKEILENILEKDIDKWMEEVQFKNMDQQFTINYKIPFDIKQKSNNDLRNSISFSLSLDDINETSLYFSHSKPSFSFSVSLISINSSGSLSSNGLNSLLNLLNDIRNIRYILKYKETSNICSVMRCLSLIEPLSEYFMSIIKNFKIFSKFEQFGLLNLTKKYFLNLWSLEKTPFEPIDFINCVEEEAKINTKEEQDPFIFLQFIISFINNNLNQKDNNLEIDFKEFEKEFKNQLYYNELKDILKENYSIIGKNFLGLILEYYICEKCKYKFEIIKEFKVINLDYISITNQFLKAGNSFVSVEIDDYLEYFCFKKHFEDHCPNCGGEAEFVNDSSSPYILCKNCKEKSFTDNYKDCQKCKKKATIKIYNKEIVRFPPYLIIRLNRGKFEEKKGFINDNDIDLPIDYAKINIIKYYYFNKAIQLDFEYELISHIDYEKTAELVKFKSISKSPFGSQNKKKDWISFDFDSPAKYEIKSKKTKKSEGKNDNSIPYILFYQMKKNNN